MNKSLAFYGREKLLSRLRQLYLRRAHVLIVGPAGIGKTAILRQLRQVCPFLHCEETSSLRRIADGLERQLGWTHRKLNVIERKNRLLAYLAKRGEPVVFDHVAATAPRVARYMGRLGEAIPIWIACRSDQSSEIGHVWQYLCKFTRIAIPPLSTAETQRLIAEAITARKHPIRRTPPPAPVASDERRQSTDARGTADRTLGTALPNGEFRSRSARA